jgi:hypothetical protein
MTATHLRRQDFRIDSTSPEGVPSYWFDGPAALDTLCFAVCPSGASKAMKTIPSLRTPHRLASRPGGSVPGFAAVFTAIFLFLFFATPTPSHAKEHELTTPGLVVEFTASLEDVMQALREVLQDQTIHGTSMFAKDPTITGAKAVDSTPVFGPWNSPGKAFYKVRTEAIAPKHFLDTTDQGTVAVRYVVTSVTPDRTRLRIDAVYVEASRHVVHPSDGTVEASERKVFEDHLQTIQFAEQEAADAQRRRESIDLAKQTFIRQREDESTRLATAQSSAQDLEARVNSLRHELERRVKPPGADLKAAPFRSAANVVALTAYTHLVIVIVTPHWYGVETPDGQRGWLPLDQLEPLP